MLRFAAGFRTLVQRPSIMNTSARIASQAKFSHFAFAMPKLCRREFVKALGKFRGKVKIQNIIQGNQPK
jgi:hypothetical protein